ncbi:VOC family protein [Streptosporangium sp. CA-135522]|uniref:VOC family protein n=1 Tax=Streptosporangium sp. CA-135522 TaxID=3240072 RepID=UPI003D8C7DBF
MNITTTTVSLNVDDVTASGEFFTTHLGFREAVAAEGFISLVRDDAAADIVLLSRGTEVLPPEQRGQHVGGVIVAFTVTDIAAEQEQLRGEGATITMPLRTEPWGERLFQLTDPNGIVVRLVEWVAPAEA